MLAFLELILILQMAPGFVTISTLTILPERECTLRAEACGISAIDFDVALRAQETIAQSNATIDRAVHAGVFGVPTFIANSELFWGNDRLILLRHYLESQQNIIPST